jgi:DNA polymerase III subunit epsilon
VQQRIERKSRTEQENAIFRTYGYYWKKEMVEAYEDWEEAWVLHTPDGAQISPPDALQEIARLQVHKPGHPSTLWAYDLLSLSHPLVLILDTETTGFGEDAEIIDLALVDKNGQIYLNSLVQCQQEVILQEAMKVHRIHKSMLRNAPTFPQVWSDLAPLLSAHEVVIYNAEYDLRLLWQTAKRYHLELPEIQAHCLMKHYSSYVGQASAHSECYRNMRLAAAYLQFQIEQTTMHRALADAQASLEVLHKLAVL